MPRNSGMTLSYRAILLAVLALGAIASGVLAQDPADVGIPAGPSGVDDSQVSPPVVPSPATQGESRLNLMWLLLQGGVIMIPIGVASIIAIAIILEQLLSLRTQRIMPRRLIEELSELADRGRLLDPRKAYQICQDYPSAASRIIRAALLKVGRPQAEIEQTVNDTCQREADRMHAHVRWLYMITTIAPLLGLLGTVWGMIRSFYDMTLLTGGQNRAVFLAAGIYTALVTTLAGLTVAIPTAVAAHFFEGRIISLLHRITDFVANLLPQWEPFEGKVRVTPETLRPAAGRSNGAEGESTHHDALGEPKLSASG